MKFLVALLSKLKGASSPAAENFALNPHTQPESEGPAQPPGFCRCLMRWSKIHRVTCPQVERMIQLRENGRILKDIAFVVDVPPTNVSRILKYGLNSQQGCSDSRREWYNQRIREIRRA